MTNQTGRYCYDFPRPAVTVDILCCRQYSEPIEFALIQRRDPPFAHRWALPGGFVEMDEELEDAARRELYEETHLLPFFVEQFYTFGNVFRDPRGRTITVAYLALVDTQEVAVAGSDAGELAWYTVEHLPALQLAFDHNSIISRAMKTIEQWRQLGLWPD